MIEGLTFEAAPEAVTRPLVSLIVPVLNEQDAVIPFVQAIDGMVQSQWPVLEDRPRLEIIFVDDGSTDATAAVLRGLCAGDKRVKLVQLSRNFGKEAALSAGLKASRGDAVVPMDVDLQDPPELLRPMIDRWQSGVQVVNARRCDRSSDTMFKRSSAQLFYKAINSLADHPIAEDVGDFRLFDRAAVDALNEMTEHSRFNKGLFSWIGFRTETLDYVRPQRAVGDTKWKFSKLLALAIDGIVASTTFPLRIWTILGSVISLLAFGYAGFLVIRTVLFGVDTPGYASLMAAVLMLGGLNLLSLGLMGEYIGRIAKQVRGRPLYIVADKVGF
ncbi:MAG: glycosyltransferase family 2 protein [Blastomonas sp.]|jgi:glycosyltransferase involved in cell wall biosynthesis|uniref:glycosyltransferase family 2 protein n=1 Tax=unclassified Blastomonas TaxID=2626550 RepID=UPI00083DD622|nr:MULTISPECIES: glycosyltransferase family 2 protein [unclassified Blastomonas]AOG01751.1 glycosyltransferase like 2 family protein [Blastomonas sp. RAC04]MCO5791600.1 glycosyltransferase family 2 protein [Blastomonas sp.]